ncbi:MAG: hypothetical protein U0U69_02185 [Acidimicrobiia bacterium]
MKDVPEFVRGVVDLAQRVATSRCTSCSRPSGPAGWSTRTARANTNLASRCGVSDPTENNDVVSITQLRHGWHGGLAGRGYVRLGAAGAASSRPHTWAAPRATTPRCAGAPLRHGNEESRRRHEADEDAEGAPTSTTSSSPRPVTPTPGTGLDPMPQPWLRLPDSLPLDHLPAADHGGFAPVVGLVDLPQAQRQDVWALDFGALGRRARGGGENQAGTAFYLRACWLRLQGHALPPGWSCTQRLELPLASADSGAPHPLSRGGVVFGDGDQAQRATLRHAREHHRRAPPSPSAPRTRR